MLIHEVTETKDVVHHLKTSNVEDAVTRLGLLEGTYTVYDTLADFAASPAGIARRTARAHTTAELERSSRALARVKALRPELANDTAMAVIYALWPALDKSLLPPPLKAAVREWATEKGYI